MFVWPYVFHYKCVISAEYLQAFKRVLPLLQKLRTLYIFFPNSLFVSDSNSKQNTTILWDTKFNLNAILKNSISQEL